MKDLIFVISDGQAGSEKVKGILPANHFGCRILRSREEDCLMIKDSILCFIGSLTYHGLNPRYIEILKNNGNIILQDPVDALCYYNPWAQPGESPIPMDQCINEHLCIKDIHGILAPNSKSAEALKSITDAEVIYIPHNIDTHFYNIEQEKNQYFSIGYGGNLYHNEFFQNVPKGLDINGQGHTDDVVRFCKKHSCHFSHRKSDTVDFKLKPASKVIVASVCNSPIVCSRDWSNRDLLPEDYPLYVSDDRSDVLDKIEYARSIFGTKAWSELLDIGKDIVNRTTLEGLEKTYTDLFNKFNWSRK